MKLFCLYLFPLITGIILFTSCDRKENLLDSDDKITLNLVGTSWQSQSVTFYDYNDNQVSRYDDSSYPTIITFTNEKANNYNEDLILYVNYHKYNPSYNGYTYLSWWNVSNNNLNGFPGAGNCFGEILNISSTEIRTKYVGNWENEWYRIDVYSPTKEPVHKFKSENDEGNIGGVTSEKPEVGFYDFTATKTSLKVQYKIYNKDEAGVKSAKIYYGTSSNPTTSKTVSVSGTMITANITGLKAGTTYYVKCSVTGKAGTTTTEVTKCITNY